MIEKLLAYQEMDANLKSLEAKILGSEERKKVASAKKYLEGVEENLNKLNAQAGDIYSTYEALKSKQEKALEKEQDINKALLTLQDGTEAEYLLKKANELMQELKNIDQELNKLSSAINEMAKEYNQIKNSTALAQAQFAEYRPKYEAIRNEIQPEKEKVEAQLAELAKGIDKNLMELYLKKRAEKIFPIVNEVKANGKDFMCGKCYNLLDLSAVSKLNKGELVECDHCHTLMFKK